MDYSKLSDFEINKRVAEVIYKDRDGLFVARNLPSREEVTIVVEVNSEDICIAAADYCNKAADAWPIIADNHIGIAPYPNEAFAWSSRHGMASDLSTEDKNPLRAAMVVFLMMKDEHYA